MRTFAATVWGGSIFRIAISATPFLLPLMFQIGFGLDAYQAGLLVLAVFAGNLAMKPGTTAVLKALGFRTRLVVAALVNAAMIFACAFLSPDTPTTAVVGVLYLSGMASSARRKWPTQRTPLLSMEVGCE